MVILPHRRKAFRSSAAPAGETDPYWSSVKLLLHQDTSSFLDSSTSPAAVTVNSTSLESTIKKFGVGAASHGVTSTTSTFLSIANDGRFDLTNEDWTVEGWIYLPSPATSNRRFFGSSFLRIIGTTTAGNVQFSTSINNFTSTINIGSMISVGVDTWAHFAVTRQWDGSTFQYRVFIDGVESRTASNANNHTGAGIAITLGGIAGGGNCIPSYSDDIRVTVGVARYTSNFTPPTSAYPNG